MSRFTFQFDWMKLLYGETLDLSEVTRQYAEFQATLRRGEKERQALQEARGEHSAAIRAEQNRVETQLRSMTKKEVINFYQDYVGNGNPNMWSDDLARRTTRLEFIDIILGHCHRYVKPYEIMLFEARQRVGLEDSQEDGEDVLDAIQF